MSLYVERGNVKRRTIEELLPEERIEDLLNEKYRLPPVD